MRTKWTTKGNWDADSSCSCDQGLHRYLAEYLHGILMALIHTSVTMLMSRHALERKKYQCGCDSWQGGLFTKQLRKWVKAVFLLGCYGCIFRGTGEFGSALSKLRNFGGVWTPQTPSPRYATATSQKTWILMDIATSNIFQLCKTAIKETKLNNIKNWKCRSNPYLSYKDTLHINYAVITTHWNNANHVSSFIQNRWQQF